MLLEKEVFFAAYSIRKLIEAKKLSEEVCGSQWPMKVYSNLRGVTWLNWHKIDELYDFDNGSCEYLEIYNFCNLLIHSYVFVPSFGNNGLLLSILFSSDRRRNEKLYELKLSSLVSLLNYVGNDYPSETHAAYDVTINDYRVKNLK